MCNLTNYKKHNRTKDSNKASKLFTKRLGNQSNLKIVSNSILEKRKKKDVYVYKQIVMLFAEIPKSRLGPTIKTFCPLYKKGNNPERKFL